MGPSPKLRRTKTSDPDDEPIIRLACQVKDYSFGKKGSRSLVARYALANEKEGHFKVDEEQAYGEIWIGGHRDSPSQSFETSVHLTTLIEQSPAAFLTHDIATKYSGPGNSPRLPFNFKVLSFDKILPLQVHPDRSLAEKLQNRDTNRAFADLNHKPGVVIALSPRFDSFVGFRPIEEIKCFLQDVEELRELLVDEVQNITNAAEGQVDNQLRDVFGKLSKKEKSQIEKLTKKLLGRIQKEGNKALGEIGERDELGDMAQKVWRQHPGDPGLFAAVFFLKLLTLKRGEGVVVPPGCIHAYIDGDILECIANGDNVLSRSFQGRAEPPEVPGLFEELLLHNPTPAEHLILQQKPFSRSRNSHTAAYNALLDEFSLLKVSLDRAEEEFFSIDGPALYVVTAGEVEVSARVRPSHSQQAEDIRRDSDTPGPREAVASEGGHVPLLRRGSECSRTGEEGQKEHLSEGMCVFVKPGYEVGFWNKGGGKAEIHAAYCEVDK
ncbi:hypothetical protein DRE_04011 [Drechslerella stenobrocha 248]|uniref:Mannose-6-phosphate isomerase n=1 Tax=Drechslerella stenobrocha 248 TaxID=1043628 RepID=W7HRT3_9PEZI|nr:hypothetical protein DRE_04011 [Drechslerella stenobrocha 248]